MVAETVPDGVAPEFVHKLETARSNLRVIASLCIVGGVFSLTFMLLMAYQMRGAMLNMAHVSFLVGGAIAFAIGIGLLSFSEGARQAGSIWLLSWGIVNLIVGFTAAWQGQLLIGIFCMVSGAIQVVFADLLHLPAEIFVCAYTGGELTSVLIVEGILKGHGDTQHRGMAQFVATAQPAPGVHKVKDRPV
ncbi:hypothetical protein LLH23_22900 [bacterium]|nr:hypothetical protein [bacterium]